MLIQLYLYETIDECHREDDDSGKRSGHQHDDTDFHQFKEVTKHHFQPIWDHIVYGICFLCKAIEKVAARCGLKE